MSLSELLAAGRPPRERPPAPESEPWTTYLGFGLLIAAVVGTVLFATAPSPYVVERPGPVFDTLGEVQSSDGDPVPLIEIPDETTYPTSGRLDLLTVYVDGSRENPLSWLEVAQAWFDPSRTVLPIDAVYPEGQTEDEADEESAAAMETSQEDAVAAALTELDIPYESVLTVAGVIEDTPSDGVLEEGDEILTAEGEVVTDVDGLRAILAEAGIGTPVELGIRRGVDELTVVLAPVASEQDGSPVIGVYASSVYDFPIEVLIQLENVGGPSAGMMFALGIYDKMTPGELTGGEHIAGTGTIGGGGQVGAIGGIVQKMYGARDAGATWFLAPASNCTEVVGHIPSGIEVFSVANLDDAIEAVEAIADDDTAELARCG
ncbi:PDZ domain-containing protein [Pseudolysinimonas sp.]|uniref:YlbL family protein n=1 Tax=Pseudolysinimonas sp. TaxID=2680009 RepID=UPI00286BE600|nr:PDZ domain-containing protein [Pseudolysinimonas sp.]